MNEKQPAAMEAAIKMKADSREGEEWRDNRWAWVQYVDMVNTAEVLSPFLYCPLF